MISIRVLGEAVSPPPRGSERIGPRTRLGESRRRRRLSDRSESEDPRGACGLAASRYRGIR